VGILYVILIQSHITNLVYLIDNYDND